MAIAVGYITRPEEVVDMIYDTIVASALPIEYIGRYNEKRLPVYPAMVIYSAGIDKEYHATHTFNLTFRVLIWVYHAKLDLGSAERSREDLELCTEVEKVLEEDMTFGGRLIHSFVESEEPAIGQPFTNKAPAVKSTRMMWMGVSQRRFYSG